MKKGNIGNLPTVALAVVIIIVTIVAGALILSNFEESATAMNTATGSQNATLAQAVAITLTQDDATGTIAVYNWTGTALLLTTGNYTPAVTAGIATVTGLAASEYNGTLVEIRYDYNFEDWASNATIEGLTSLDDLAGWMPLIVIIIIASIIIAIISGVGRGGKR